MARRGWKGKGDRTWVARQSVEGHQQTSGHTAPLRFGMLIHRVSARGEDMRNPRASSPSAVGGYEYPKGGVRSIVCTCETWLSNLFRQCSRESLTVSSVAHHTKHRDSTTAL